MYTALRNSSITAGNSVVRGLVINTFRRHGMLIETGGGNVIEGNYIGIGANGNVIGQTSGVESLYRIPRTIGLAG